MHVETAVDHRARDLGLVLHGDVRFADLLTRAVRACLRQRCVVGFVDPRWHATMRVRTMSLARLATGRLRFRDRRSLRERRRLSFATPSLFFQRRSQIGDLLTQGLQFLPQLGTLTTIVSTLLRVHDHGDYQTSPEGASSSR